MHHLERLSDGISVGPQLQPGDMAIIAAEGFQCVINNRPDGEEPGQPTSDQMESAALAAGLDYLHFPVWGMPDEQSVDALAQRLANGQSTTARTAMFCRSGTRSAILWAMAATRSGAVTPDEARTAAAAAGYDLSRLPL